MMILVMYWNVDNNDYSNNNEDENNDFKQQNINNTTKAAVEIERNLSKMCQKIPGNVGDRKYHPINTWNF